MTANRPYTHILKSLSQATRLISGNALLSLAYIGGARIGFHLAFLHSQVSPVWPPEGISLAIVLLFGFRLIPGVLLGAFAANYMHNPHLPTAIMIAFGNTLSVSLAAYLVRRFTERNNPFTRARDVLSFLTIGTMPGAAASALIGVTSLFLAGFVPPEAYGQVVLTWWTGEMQGLIIVAPFLYAWFRIRRSFWNWKKILEGLLIISLLLAAGLLVFRTPHQLTYLPIPIMIWAILRFGLQGAVTSIMIVSGTAIYHTINHHGPFAVDVDGELNLNDSLLLLELYIGILTVMTLVLVAIITEREDAMRAQQSMTADLKAQKNAFFRFVPTQFLNILGKKDAVEIELGDSNVSRMSVLFSDLRDFTAISEALSPQENIELINSYLALMEPNIQQHGGFVDKYIGDAVMALFDQSVPESQARESSADRAVRAALGMLEALSDYNAIRIRRGHRALECGIGIGTGELVLGTVGSTSRIDTTVIGDTVNVASRVERLTALFRLPLLITGETYQAMRTKRRYHFRLIDRVAVRGRLQPLEIYEVLPALRTSEIKQKVEAGRIMAEARRAYERRAFKTALRKYQRAYRGSPEYIIQVYIQRCEACIKKPPPRGWNAVEVMLEK
ncbi:MAG: MASE1 domain-containing protein [Leptospiraceae bacterium]|nr:MASE1 domain-containing protein [Leptospiraceae bacterium]